MNSRSLGPPLSVSSPSCNHIVRCDALEFDSFTLCIDDLHPTMISISTNHAIHHGSGTILILHRLSDDAPHKLYFIQIITQDIQISCSLHHTNKSVPKSMLPSVLSTQSGQF